MPGPGPELERLLTSPPTAEPGPTSPQPVTLNGGVTVQIRSETVSMDNAEETARVIATGRSTVSGTEFNLVVAFEPSGDGGPAIAQSTFHHFADYNWNPQLGAPSFVAEPPGDALAHSPEAQRSIERYVRNLALWLAGRPVDTVVAE